MALCESKHCSVLNICKAFKMILNPNIVYLNDSHLNAVSLHFCVKQIMTCMKNEQTVKNKMIKGESKEYHTYKPKWKTKQTKTIRCNSWPCTHKTLRNVTSKWRALFFFYWFSQVTHLDGKPSGLEHLENCSSSGLSSSVVVNTYRYHPKQCKSNTACKTKSKTNPLVPIRTLKAQF